MADSVVLKVVLQAGYEKTAEQFLNLTKTTANTAAFQFETTGYGTGAELEKDVDGLLQEDHMGKIVLKLDL